jgi:hypothetical protein
MSEPEQNEHSDYRPNGSRALSRDFLPIGIALGLGLTAFGVHLVVQFVSASASAREWWSLSFGLLLVFWGLHFVVGYLTLAFYLARRPAIARRERAGLPTSISTTDIDHYDMPLRSSVTGRPTVDIFSTGGRKGTPLIALVRAVMKVNLFAFAAVALVVFVVGIVVPRF